MVAVKTAPYVEQRAELRVYGSESGHDFDPDDLTALLAIAPHTVWRRGESLRSGRTRPATVWWWQSETQVDPDSELLVKQVLDTFEPVADRLDDAKARWGLKLEIGLVVSMFLAKRGAEPAHTFAATPSMAFTHETLSRLTRFGASLDADLYVDEIESDDLETRGQRLT